MAVAGHPFLLQMSEVPGSCPPLLSAPSMRSLRCSLHMHADTISIGARQWTPFVGHRGLRGHRAVWGAV
eukprot:6165382-Amphidinium_carterae.1